MTSTNSMTPTTSTEPTPICASCTSALPSSPNSRKTCTDTTSGKRHLGPINTDNGRICSLCGLDMASGEERLNKNSVDLVEQEDEDDEEDEEEDEVYVDALSGPGSNRKSRRRRRGKGKGEKKTSTSEYQAPHSTRYYSAYTIPTRLLPEEFLRHEDEDFQRFLEADLQKDNVFGIYIFCNKLNYAFVRE
ncbi:hypothetical protein K440DRAFT_638298 [Wilcoxina mikolae CBS 423.85]|nr:hypothetical protein K440DRAFT_638298 [Wilcoxina mikolae CBS 423.85]